MRYLIIGLALAVVACGCGRKSSLLLERPSRGPMAEVPEVAQQVLWNLEPTTQTETKGNVEFQLMHATPAYLLTLFNDKAIFGTFAGMNPYYPEHLVFYVKIANKGEQKIRIHQSEFVLVDDQGGQYSAISTDYVTAFAEFRQGVAGTTRGMLESASPGYFGFSIPVGKMFAQKPQNRFALLQQSALQNGYLYPGVVHDGLVAFWNPSRKAKKMRLMTGIKTEFDANDWPQKVLEYAFDLTVVKP